MINKQSNAYTIIYITVMVVIVGAALAFTAMSLKDRQLENADADKMKQILQSVHITTERSTVVEDFQKYITSAFVINDRGSRGEKALRRTAPAGLYMQPSRCRHQIHPAASRDGALGPDMGLCFA